VSIGGADPPAEVDADKATAVELVQAALANLTMFEHFIFVDVKNKASDKSLYRYQYDFLSLPRSIRTQLACTSIKTSRSAYSEDKARYRLSTEPTNTDYTIPEIKARRKKYTGYYIDLTSNLLDTNLRADQFIDASMAFDLCMKTREDYYLDLLVAILYPDGDIKTLKKLTLVELLELMVKELRDAVQSLSGMDKTSIEIVEATKLSLEQVNFLLK
jgi:hypothetical protein